MADTGLSAAGRFAAQLAADGIQVTPPVRARAPQDAVPLASRDSLPLRRAVEYMLKASDNNIAETLLRLAAPARHRPADWQGGTQVVRSVLEGYGVPLDGSPCSTAAGCPARTG
ncbi:hypothetical protein GXW82_16335 [Streptacidiphilus sp. 4-A2]|nr:hypothetical protein [Streptacidiphilus sp. 4-A2]